MTEPTFDQDRLDVYRLAMGFDGIAESQAEYHAVVDYEHEHRCTEHEHEHEGQPEQNGERERLHFR